jgi:hypothetical protein
MKILKTTLFLAVFFMPFQLLAAAKFDCAQSGLWSSTTTWTITSGSDADGIPDADDDVTITQKTVTLNSDIECDFLRLNSATIDANDVYDIVINNIKNLSAFGLASNYLILNSYLGGNINFTTIIMSKDIANSYGLMINNSTCNVASILTIFELTPNDVFIGAGSILRITTLPPSNTFVNLGLVNILTDNVEPLGGFGILKIETNAKCVSTSIQCPLVINGSLEVTNAFGNILGLSTTPEYPITGTGKIILQKGGLLNSSVGLAPLELKGPSLENYTVLNSLPIIFNGTTPQTLSGPGTINKVTVDNPNGLTIGNNDTFSINILTLINGGLILNNKDLTVNTLIGATNTRYVQTNGTGHFFQPMIPNGGFNTIPIGTATSYSPISIRTFGTNNVAYKYGANVRNGISPARPLLGVAGTDFINKEWGIKREPIPSNLTPNTVVTLPWQSADENAGANCNNFRMLHHNGTTWEALPEISTTRDCINKFIRLSNVTSFSPFAVGLANAVLSTDLISIKAAPQYQAVLVNWQTANEQNMLDFGVERSVDGLKFEQIGTVKATNAPNIYSYKDATAQDNTLYYYRLAMRENNGKTEYSKVVTATLSGKTKTVSVFPNPAKDVLNISGIESSNEWQIVDVIGKTRATYKGSQTLDLAGFSNGIYFIKIGNENRSRFVVSK